MNKKYILGLDIGISSVGWGMIELDENKNPKRIIDTGVKIFSAAEVPKTGASKTEARRRYRESRRLTRRREFRVDRTRYLLNLHGYLGDKVISGEVSKVNKNTETLFDNMVNNYYKGKNTNPYKLKVEALDRKLTKDELSIILVHYSKHRGYKSNRTDDINDKDSGKVKEQIQENKKLMQDKRYRIISEMFIKDEKFSNKIRNSKDNYNICVSREDYLNEIEKVLDSQINFGLITDEFKNEYINIWKAQRSYAKGPGGDSKYGGDLIKRMTGICKFDNLPRAPKCAPTSELFTVISTLQNIRYKEQTDSDYIQLEKDQIKKIIKLAKQQDSITYSKLLSELGIKKGYIKGLYATNKEKAEAIKKFLSKENLENFDYSSLTDEQKNNYDNLKLAEVNKRTCISLKNYSIIRKTFSKLLGTSKWEEVSNNIEMLDKIVEILTNYKVNEDVIKALKENEIDELYFGSVLELPNFKDHNMLSLDLMRKLNYLMIEGMTYDKAMEELGYNHSEYNVENEKQDLLIPINQADEINNQRVIRALSQARGIINSLIKQYGMPEKINIETARELSKNISERREITKRRDENFENNQKIKNELVELNIFGSVDMISNTDVLKYKLWKEQNSKCAYSLEPIPVESLFDNNLVQIDHILPYSRTFNDSYLNKTLVFTKNNFEKSNKTPYEWFGKTDKWNEYKSFINSLNISDEKKENYLLEKLTLEMESKFRNQNLNDTKYISKYLVSYIKANLNVPRVGSPSGSITGKLRNYWHLNGLTHSLESDNYFKKASNDIPSKNRENHLHHALDALLIAIANDSVIKNVSDYERFKRYIDNKTQDELLNMVNNNIEEKNEYFDENGELIATNLNDYLKEIIKTEYLQKKKNNTVRTILPEPYKGFSEEAKIRVYEQDKNTMKFRLKEFNYSEEELDKANPIIPKFQKEKVGGRLHGETLYKLRNNNNNTFSKISRIDIASSNFDEKKLENILDKNGGSKEVYNTIKIWLENKKGNEAYAKNNGYPINSKTGNPIKKIKIEEEYAGKGHIINGNIVDKESIMRIDIYEQKKDNKLYFVGLDTLDIQKLKRKNNIQLDLWSSQTNHELVNSSEINDNYTKVIALNKNDYIKITNTNDKYCYGYILGFSGGKIEIKSALGDGYDLIGKEKIFENLSNNGRYMITVSTIKNINKINLSNLGKED